MVRDGILGGFRAVGSFGGFRRRREGFELRVDE